jgi:hypothetical protein
MNAAARAPYLEAGDALLIPLGFRRKKSEFAWRRTVGPDVEWLHLNFGLGVINPSYGVTYADLDAQMPAELGLRCGPSNMLQSLTGTAYSSAETPPELVAHGLLKAVAEMPALRDRHGFAAELMAEQCPQKYTASFSTRIRALPVLLASLGRLEEAHAWLARFEPLAQQRDQKVPGYDVFAAEFRRIYPKPAG